MPRYKKRKIAYTMKSKFYVRKIYPCIHVGEKNIIYNILLDKHCGRCLQREGLCDSIKTMENDGYTLMRAYKAYLERFKDENLEKILETTITDDQTTITYDQTTTTDDQRA